MAFIGWGDTVIVSGDPFPGDSGFSEFNEGVNPYFVQGDYSCGVVGAYTTVVFSEEWTPVSSDPSPVSGTSPIDGYITYSLQNPDGGGDFSLGDGTLVITAIIDGQPAENVLSLACARNEFNYGSAAWTSDAEPPEPRFWTQFVKTEER